MSNLYINKLAKTTYKKLYENSVNCMGKKLTPDYTLFELLFANNEEYDNALFEEFHIARTFDDVIDDIVSMYKSNTFTIDKTKYINWNYKFDTHSCEKLNNKNIDVPIYIKFIEDEDIDTYAYIEDRDIIGNKIKVNINTAKVSNEKMLISCLLHEFLHAREMFALKDKNVLNSNKNMVPTPSEINPFIWDREHYNELCKNKIYGLSMRLVYLFSNPECRARLNGVYRYIIEDADMPNISDHKLVDYYIEETNKISCYLEMYRAGTTRLEMMLTTGFYSTLEVYIYFFHKYKLIKTTLPSYSFDKMKKLSEYTKTEIDKISAAVFEILSLLLKFKRRLYYIIHSAILNKKMYEK